MKTTDCSHRASRALMLLGFGFILICSAADSNDRENQIQQDNVQRASGLENDLKSRISAKEMRLDAVVLDRIGVQVTDLKADDFEIHQDKKKQKVTSCTYIAYNQTNPGSQPGIAKEPNPKPITSTSGLTRTDVRRRILFYVDIPSLNLTQVRRVQQFLKNFVAEKMQDGDLISITRKGKVRENDSQIFSSDRQFLLSAIVQLPLALDPWVMGSVSFKKLREMPGRTSLIVISAEPISFGSVLTNSSALSPDVIDFLHRHAADAAFRAGVVIHILDVWEPNGPDASEPGLTAEYGSSPSQQQQIKLAMEASARRRGRPQTPLAKKTGGLLVRDPDLPIKIFESIDEQLKGYYILTYTPSPDTFTPPPDLNTAKLAYHKIKIQVKRPGSKVHTRDGFLAAPERESKTGAF